METIDSGQPLPPRCDFCDHRDDLSRIGALIYQDERCAVLIHEDWSTPGHAMLVWRKHVQNVSDLSAGEATHFAEVHRRTEKALLRITGSDRAVLLKLGIQTPHLHLHIYPVDSSLDRAGVMAIIDGRVRSPGNEQLIHDLRKALTASRA